MKLGGTIFCYNGISQDYCLSESVQCLKEFCDEVIVLDAGSTDGTRELIKSFADKKTKIILCDNEEWKRQHGSGKLSYFTNKAIDLLTSEWHFNLQADEIVHEQCYPAIRRAILKENPAYIVKRINLWASPYLRLDVPHNRKPVSTEIVRLAKSKYYSYDDAESLRVPEANFDYAERIRIYHMGFVRKREIHPAKIRHMQGEIFQTSVDSKLEGMDIFEPYKWFSPEDLKPIEEPLPKIIQAWAKERTYE